MTLNLTTFNRRPWHPQVGLLVGDFTTLTLLGVDAAGETFVDRAIRLQERLWSDLEHNQVDGLEVMRGLARRGRVSQAGLMPVVFSSILGQAPGGGTEFSTGWQEKILYRITQTPQVWLDHQVTEENGGLNTNWDAVEELFPEGLLDDLFAAYEDLLRSLAEADEPWQSARPVALPEAQRAVREAINDTSAPLSPERLQDGFLRQARLRPEAPAVITPELTLSYGEVHRQARSLARRLRQRGLAPAQVVAVVMEKGWEQVVAVLGILEAGGAYLPIDPALPPERIAHLLGYLVEEAREAGGAEAGGRHAASGPGPPLAVTQPWIEAGGSWPPEVERLEVGPAQDGGPEEDAAAVESLSPALPEGLAYVIFTSGSTGLPKGVMIDHRGAVNTLRDIGSRFGISPRDRVLALSSLSFDLSVWDVFGVLGAGGALVLPAAGRDRDPGHWADLLEEHGVTVWNTVPALMELLADAAADTGRRLPESLRLVMMSGDWIPLALPEKIRALAGPDIRLVSLGGATEASIWSILHPIGEVDPAWKSIPYGRPMVNQTFHVLGGDLEPRPVWVPGELYIGGLGVALGYWRDAERTAQRFVEHPETGERLYRTGDLGRYLPDGTIEFLGREDSQVKVNGYRIELGEIEVALSRHPAVRNVVVAAPGERGSRRLVAYFVAEEGGEGAAEESLRTFVAEKLPDYMVPSAFVRLDALPLTANGKVDRGALPEPSEARPAPAGGGSELARQIAAVTAQVLGLSEVDPGTNFLEAGASSLHMIRIANLLEHELGLRIRIEDFYRTPTAAALASAQAAAGRGGAPPPRVTSEASRWAPGPPLEPAEVEAFKSRRPGLRRGDEGRRVSLPEAPATELASRALVERRSRRRFASRELPLEDLSRLLACLREADLDGHPKRLYPSAGALYPVQVYLHARPGRVQGLEAGVYSYRPLSHQLVLLGGGDLEETLHDPFVNRPIYREAAFSIFLVVQAAAIAPVYRESARDFSLLEAGYMGQLLMLQAGRCGVGLCPIGGLQFEAVADRFHLDPGHELLHSLVGGPPAEAETQGWAPAERFGPKAAPAERSPSRPPPLVAVERGDALPLSFSQKRLWLAHRMEPDNPAYNTAVLFHLRGDLRRQLFERALGGVLRRHEVLRTTYPLVGGELLLDGDPVQRIAEPSPARLPLVDLGGLGDRSREAVGELARELAAQAARRPFDLAAGPVLRSFILRLGRDPRGNEEHAVFLGFHHIVGDAWSTGIMARELGELYRASCEGRPAALPDLPLQYADFAAWQRRWLEGAVLEGQLAYWRRRLAGTPVLELPVDRRPARDASFAGARHRFAVPPPVAGRLEALGRAAGATAFVSYLGAFKLLLAWATGQSDIALGSPVTHRDRFETEGLIGFFVNTLVLRTDLSGDPAFGEVLARVGETVRGAHAHRDVPFEKVLEVLEVDRGASDTPLFRVWFVLHEEPPPAFELAGLEVEAEDVGTAAARYDLKLEMVRRPEGGFRCELEYRTSIFEEATVERLQRAFSDLLEAAGAESRRSRLEEHLTAEERKRRLSRRDSARAARGQGLRGLRSHRRNPGRRSKP